MKKLYKLALGAGATAAIAIPAVAVVSCGKVNNHKDTSQTNSKNNQNSGSNGGSSSVGSSTQPGIEIDYKSITNDGKTVSVDDVTKASQSDLLKKFKELKIADEKDTDEQFDSNLETYTVKLVDVLTSNEEALSTKDTKDLLISIITHYQDKISIQTKHDLIVMSDFVAEYVHNNHLITKAAAALNYDPKKGDTDFLEKFDAGHADLLKVASFAGSALEGFPQNIDSTSTQAILDLITSIEMPQMIKDLFPTNNEEAMKAWSEVLNSGIIQEVGHLINEAFEKGIGNVDFDTLKASVATLISKAENALVAADVRIMSINARTASTMIDSLNIPALIDVVKNIVTEGVFGINKDLVDEINKLVASPVLGIISLEVPALTSYMPLIKSAVAVVNQLDSGIANVKQEDFESELNSILSAIPGASLSDDIKSLIVKAIYHGWSTQEEFDKFVKSLLPDSIMSMSIDALGSKLEIGKILMNMLDAMYTGKALSADGILAAAKGIGIDTTVSFEVASGISPLLQKGLFALSKDEFDKAFLSIQKFASQVSSILNHPMVAPKLPDSVKPMIDPILSIVASIKPEIMTATANGIYDLLNHGIASAADEFRLAIPQIFKLAETSSINIPSFIKPIIFAAINGLDSLTVSQGEALVDWLMTFISKDMSIGSSDYLREALYVAVVGHEKLADANKAKADKIKLSAQSRVAITAENAKIDAFISQALAGSVSAETLTKPSDKVLTSDIIVPQTPNGLSVVVKTTRFSGSDVFITYTVSSSVEGTKTADYTAQLSGFQASQKLTVEKFLTELKARFNAAKITSIMNQLVDARKVFVDYLKELGVANAESMANVISTPGFSFIHRPSSGLIYDFKVYTYATFTEWLNSKAASKEATISEATKAFVDAMDAL